MVALVFLSGSGGDVVEEEEIRESEDLNEGGMDGMGDG